MQILVFLRINLDLRVRSLPGSSKNYLHILGHPGLVGHETAVCGYVQIYLYHSRVHNFVTDAPRFISISRISSFRVSARSTASIYLSRPQYGGCGYFQKTGSNLQYIFSTSFRIVHPTRKATARTSPRPPRARLPPSDAAELCRHASNHSILQSHLVFETQTPPSEGYQMRLQAFSPCRKSQIHVKLATKTLLETLVGTPM